ncbi:ankyrin repeat domain-containing protein 34B-like [Salarias fasciatus]|uniref:Ankyrin repeat domain-containing protein 34B-like n=1 Tax=Salarias fasciatus TaxID=181472 RepID=A0A672I3H6_SALFA|nr:ankyrin repeat domain-containing protein 34B-like [Salarias fasciatus]
MEDGCNPSLAVDSGNPLLRAVFLRRLRLTRLLLDGGAYINESDSQGQTPLMVACRTQHVDAQSASRVKLVQFLLEKGADPNIQDKDGRSALMHACRELAGSEVVSLLLGSGADVSLEDRTGTSALVHAVMAGDLKVLKLLLDTCKAKGKEVIIITTETFPCGKMQAKQYLSMAPLSPLEQADKATPAAPASPSEVQLISSPPCSSSLCPPKPVFSFKEAQICGASSHPCSPSRFRGLGQPTANGTQQPLLRLNSEPWLKIPASLLTQQLHAASDRSKNPNQTEELSFTVPEVDEEDFKRYEDMLVSDKGEDGNNDCAKQKISLPGLLSSHSASHPNLHSETLTGDSLSSTSSLSRGKDLHSLASSSLHHIIQRRKLGTDIYSSDPQLARDQTEGKRLAPLRCSTTLGSRESLSGSSRRVLFGYERRGSGAFLLDHSSQARPRSLPPLNNTPIPHTYSLSSGSGGSFLPSAPPGQPRGGPDQTRRRLLRRHSMQTEQFKGTA